MLTRHILADFLNALTRMKKDYGGIFKVYLGPRPRLVVADIKALEFFLGSSTMITKSYEYKFFHDWLGTGLLTSSGNYIFKYLIFYGYSVNYSYVL